MAGHGGLVMGIKMENLKEQVKDRLCWKKSIWLLDVNNDSYIFKANSCFKAGADISTTV